MKYIPVLISVLLIILSSCKTAETGTDTDTGTASADVKTEDLQEQLMKDPFFTAPAISGESIRILITEKGYAVKQIGLENRIRFIPDEAGNKEQFNQYKEFSDKFNFKDWVLDAMIDLKISSKTGYIEESKFVPNKMPKTWQAARLFMEDISRYRFEHVNENDPHRNVRVSYEWRIPREPGLSEEQAKQRTIEFLKSEVRQ